MTKNKSATPIKMKNVKKIILNPELSPESDSSSKKIGRPKIDDRERENISVYLPTDIVKKIKQKAKNKASVSSIAAEILENSFSECIEKEG